MQNDYFSKLVWTNFYEHFWSWFFKIIFTWSKSFLIFTKHGDIATLLLQKLETKRDLFHKLETSEIPGTVLLGIISQRTICTVAGLLWTLSWRRPLSYRNQSIDLRSKSMDWFLCDNGLRHEMVKVFVQAKICSQWTMEIPKQSVKYVQS